MRMPRWPASAADCAVSAGFGIIGALALGMGALCRDRLEWYDAYVDVLVSGLHARSGVHDARILSEAGPYVGAALVFVALLVARRRGAPPGELLRPLTALAVALLCVEFLKLAIYRDRPFNLGPAQHDSFPSGDTAQVALCAATALHLVRRLTRDWLRWGLALIGATAAIAIAISRVYLSRHWVSDVAASLLIGVLFWSAAPRWRASPRKLVLAVSAIAVLGMSGPRLTLPSPMTFDDQRHFELPLATGVPRDGLGQGGRRVWRVRTAGARFSVVQLELVPRAGDADGDDWLHLEVDRDRVASVPLATHRGMYALPLPRLTSGFHEVRLQAQQGGRHPLPLSLNLVRVSIEGAAGHVVVSETARLRDRDHRHASLSSYRGGAGRKASHNVAREKRARGGLYYTRSRRIGGRVVREYVRRARTGEVAELLAALAARDRAERESRAVAWRPQCEHFARTEATLGELSELGNDGPAAGAGDST